MAVTSSGDGNFSSVITGGLSVNDDVIINHDVTLDGDAPNVNSLVINSGKTITGGGNTITIDSRDSATGLSIDINGSVSGDLNIVIANNLDNDLGLGTDKVHDLTINNDTTARINSLAETASITGNLTITQGILNTQNRGLTVAGTTTIGPNSGAADQATLTCNASTISLGASETSSFALRVAQGGTFTGGTGAHTIGSLEVVNSAAAKCTMTSNECSISSERSGSKSIIVETNATFDNNDGTIKITHAGDTDIEFKSGTTSPKCPHNLTIDKSDNDVITHGDLRIDNNLFIKIVDTSHSMRPSSASDTLTVIGDVTINKGKLGATTNYTSAISFGSLTIDSDGEYIATSGTTTLSKEADTGGTDFMFYNDGTFTHNNGKFVFDDAGLSSSSNVRCSSSFYDVEITMGSFSLTSHHNMNVANDFTVTTGTYSDGSNGFTITGDVSVASTATLNLSNSSTQTKTLGSISVASGGTFRACRGTTIITNEKSGHAWKNDGGTFTHNSGKVKFDLENSAGSSSVKENEFYDVEIDMFASTYSLSFFDVSGNAVTILNNLDITKGEMDFSTASDTITIHGLTKIAADGTFSDNAAHDTNKIIHNGLVTNSGTYKINDGTTVKMNGGIRNLGTITVA